MPRPIGLLSAILLSLVGALAERERDDLWVRYNNYRSTYLSALPDSAAMPALTSRVIVLLIRGLRADVSQSMPTLNGLREHGSDYTLQAGTPLYRLPQLMTLLIGTDWVKPERHYSYKFLVSDPLKEYQWCKTARYGDAAIVTMPGNPW